MKGCFLLTRHDDGIPRHHRSMRIDYQTILRVEQQLRGRASLRCRGCGCSILQGTSFPRGHVGRLCRACAFFLFQIFVRQLKTDTAPVIRWRHIAAQDAAAALRTTRACACRTTKAATGSVATRFRR
jgi:hypothetical protein